MDGIALPTFAEGEVCEKDAQAVSEVMMADPKQQWRAPAKAQSGDDSEASTSEKTATKMDMAATGEVIASLRFECDWLMQNFETDGRKEVRTDEIELFPRSSYLPTLPRRNVLESQRIGEANFTLRSSSWHQRKRSSRPTSKS